MATQPGDDIPALISEYVAAAQSAARIEDVPAQNRAADRLAEIHRALIRSNAVDALIPVLAHEAPEVRGWAAAHLLLHRPELAEPVLVSIGAGGGLEGFNARWTLRTWREGSLRFP